MTPFESAYDEVAKLVNQFAEHEDQYLSHKYQESEVRGDFIDKFWKALGWDVNHKYQTNPREQEVKVEKNPDSNASGRKADYAFYLKPDYRNPIFFCEAKKPRHDLGSPEFYFQLVRYGRAAGTPVSVLFDFEEFHVVDCRYEANLQKSFPSAQIKAFRYKDYLDRDKFGDIYWLFSREAVEAGKLKEFAKSLPKQRGKGAAKLTAEEAKPADEALLTKLEEYRLQLAKAFKKADESLDAETLTEATQKVIDRLVFIRFLEDKNIEADYIVDQIAAVSVRHPERSEGSRPEKEQTKPSARSFAAAPDDAPKSRKTRTAWESFIAWSRELDVKYNGVVFKPHEIDKPSFIPPDDKVFGDICRDISFGHSKYIFSYIPIELIGSIYERFLGKVVTATAKRADIEYKPEVRKAGGVYYTPKYIVDYIVANTVGKILGSTPTSDVILSEAKDLAPDVADDSQAEILRSAQDDRKKLSPKEVSKLRFADIACGSGSFLIAVYDAVLHHVESWYNAHPDEARKAKCIEIDKGGNGRPPVFTLSLRQKQQILLDNIYGVDIDPQAVEVAQLSLFLKLLEGESGATAGQMSFEKTKILPDLSKNIVCGNSLVDYDITDLFPLTPEEEERIKPFSFETTFRDIMRDGGFDAIVGNPPYLAGREWDERLWNLRKYFSQSYESMTDQYDLYALFIQRAINLLRQRGRFGYITPNTWLNNEHYRDLREWILRHTNVSTIADFRNVRVFKAATVLTVVCVLEKTRLPDDNTPTVIELFEDAEASTRFTTSASNWRSFPGSVFNLSMATHDLDLLRKIETGAKRVGDVAEVRFGVKVYQKGKGQPKQTGVEAKDKVFESPSKLDSRYFPYLHGKDISSMYRKRELTWLAYGPHLAEPRTIELFEGPRVLVRRIVGDRLIVCPVEETLIADQLIHTVKPTNGYDSKVLAALLNSKLLAFYFKKRYNRNEKTFPEIRVAELSSLPLKTPEPPQSVKYQSLVEQLIDARSRLILSKRDSERDQLQRKCEYLDAQIDRLVYELYGLTEEEIKIVEGRWSVKN